MGRRLAARGIDGLLCGILAAAGSFPFFLAARPIRPTGTGITFLHPVWLIPFLAVLVLIPLLYETIGIVRGATWGKRRLGLRVVRRGGGEVPGVGRALWRSLVCFGFWPGVLTALFDGAHRRALHDFAAGTKVVPVRGAA